MDIGNFKVSDWLMVGGGAAMLVLGLFLDWTTISQFGVTASGDNPFQYFLTGGISWILVSAVGVLAFLRAGGQLPPSQPWPIIFLGATGLSVILMLIQLIMGARFDFADRGIGMYGAFVWAAVAAAGAFMSFTESGGDIKDLTDMDKLKGAFGSGSDAATDAGDASGDDTLPPPPPPPSTPPPPSSPPPPAG